MWETWVQSLGWEDPLEKGKATPLQYSGLGNSMDCICIVHGVAKLRTSWEFSIIKIQDRVYKVTVTPQESPCPVHNLPNHPQQPGGPHTLCNATSPPLALPRTPHTLANLSFRHSGSPEGKEETRAYMNSCVPFSAAASAPSWSGGSRAGTHEGGYWGWCRRRRGSQSARRRETRTRLGRRKQTREPSRALHPAPGRHRGASPPPAPGSLCDLRPVSPSLGLKAYKLSTDLVKPRRGPLTSRSLGSLPCKTGCSPSPGTEESDRGGGHFTAALVLAGRGGPGGRPAVAGPGAVAGGHAGVPAMRLLAPLHLHCGGGRGETGVRGWAGLDLHTPGG